MHVKTQFLGFQTLLEVLKLWPFLKRLAMCITTEVDVYLWPIKSKHRGNEFFHCGYDGQMHISRKYQYFLLSKCRKFPATTSLNYFLNYNLGWGFFWGGRGCQSSFKNPCNYFYDLLIIFL